MPSFKRYPESIVIPFVNETKVYSREGQLCVATASFQCSCTRYPWSLTVDKCCQRPCGEMVPVHSVRSSSTSSASTTLQSLRVLAPSNPRTVISQSTVANLPFLSSRNVPVPSTGRLVYPLMPFTKGHYEMFNDWYTFNTPKVPLNPPDTPSVEIIRRERWSLRLENI